MQRRIVLLVAALAAMIGLGALAGQKRPQNLLVLEWAAKASAEAPPTAILIEMGMKDEKPSPWAGRAVVQGARVVHREGYRFRAGDKLTDPDGWQASSHRPLRLPKAQPVIAKMEGMASVGVVLHLADVRPDAVVALEPRAKEFERATVPLRDVLAGKPVPLDDGRLVVRRISAAMPVVTTKTEDDFPAAAYGPDGTLWVAYISYTLKDEGRRIEQSPYKEQPANFRELYTPEFGDQLFVKAYRTGTWSEPIAVTEPREDLVRCAVAVEGNGTVWVGYSAHRQGRHDICVRPLTPSGGPAPRLGEEKVLTRDATLPGGIRPTANTVPVMCTDPAGVVWLAWQGWSEGTASIFVAHLQDGAWKMEHPAAARGPGNRWHASLAATPEGVAAATDHYAEGDYSVSVILAPGGRAEATPAASTSRFEARPALACDRTGRLWIAYEEGPVLWGKDYGALDSNDGNPLYNERSVRVVCLHDGKLFRPTAELPTSSFKAPSLPFEAQIGNRFERATRYAYPQVGIDGKGRVWLTYRQKFGSRYSSHPGSYWITYARRLDGDRWSDPIELHHSDGLLDHRPVLLPHPAGGLLVLHNTDGRYTTPDTIDNQVYMSYVDLPGEPVEPKLEAHDAGKKDPALVQRAAEEAATVQRIRGHRIVIGGKTYRPLRGEFHRHTEVSWDGGPDGSLEDMFRYGLDAARMDWIGNGDHDSGAGREYSWWLIQKLTDAYHVKDAFTPMFTYERSVAYPHGHRNCMFARRGIRTLPRLAAEEGKAVAGVHADDTKMLYRYLRELDGICAVHTSATSMGTDWRDNDPKVEPIVEIYQGDRMSYEYEAAPRAGYDPKSGKQPANVAGWFPAGFLDNAFKKGYRLGFQSSSDHWSTHISYCIPLAERHDREAILDALKRRHCYGATDDIILDVRCGDYLMGDEFKSAAAPRLDIHVIGTKPIARIDIHKDSKVVQTIQPNMAEFKGAWTDPQPDTGVHYYYVRVQQTDGELAWGSPLWIDYAK